MWKKNINWFPFIYYLTRNQNSSWGICPDLLVCGAMLEPTKPPSMAVSIYLLTSPFISSLTQSFFNSMLFNLHIFVGFFTSILQLISNFQALWWEGMLGIILLFLTLLRPVCYPSYGLSLRLFCVYWRRMLNLIFWGERLSVNVNCDYLVCYLF